MNNQYKQILMHASSKKKGSGSHWSDSGEVKKSAYETSIRGGGTTWDKTTGDKIRDLDPFKKLSDYVYNIKQENDKLREKGIDPYSKKAGYIQNLSETNWRGSSTNGQTKATSTGTIKSGQTRYLPEPSDMWTGSNESIKSDIASNSRTWSSKSWGDPNSKDFKDTKKEYNEWYYQTHKDKWKNQGDSNKPKITAPSSATASMYKNKAQEEAGKAYGTAMGNFGKTHTNTLTYDSTYKRGESALNNAVNSGATKVSFSSLWKAGVKSILNAGKSFLSKISSLFS